MEIPTSHTRRRARIEIVPLIDIMFFLLATFVMVSISMVKNRGINVVLPEAVTGTPLDHKGHVVISISEAGLFYLDKVEMDRPHLLDELGRLKQANPELKVFINGDQNARLGLAIGLLDETRKLGLTKVAFETRPGASR